MCWGVRLAACSHMIKRFPQRWDYRPGQSLSQEIKLVYTIFIRNTVLLVSRHPAGSSMLQRAMRPTDIQQVGDELAVKWDDGSESYVKLEKLRRHCPCAGCKGETDIMGNVYKNPERHLAPAAFQLVRVSM